MRRSLLWLLAFAGSCGALRAAELEPEVVRWLAAQTNVQTWSAEFRQTRTLKSLTQPLTTTGHVWFTAPNKFRWELGQPAQTIALRASQEMLVIYPRLKRVERYPLTGDQADGWRDTLALLEAGFPRSGADLEAQYNILSQNAAGGTAHLVLQPKSPSARRMMPRIEIDFDTQGLSLRATELHFADGSSLRNDFTNTVLNPPLASETFSAQIPPDFKVVEPLKKP